MNSIIPIQFGTDFKLQVIINDLPDEVTMQSLDFQCEFHVGASSIKFNKEDLKNPDDDVFIAPIQTQQLERGDLWFSITAAIPDSDFPDGFRNEIQRKFTRIKII